MTRDTLAARTKEDTLCRKGERLLKAAEPKRALGCFEEALRLHREAALDDPERLAGIYDQLGTAHFWRNEYEDAEHWYKNAISELERCLYPEHGRIAHVLDHLAQLYVVQSKFAEAAPVCRRTLEIKRKCWLKTDKEPLESMRMCAIIERELGNFEESQALLKEAIDLLEPTSLGPFEDFLHELAKTYEVQGRYEEALDVYSRAIDVYCARSGRAHHYASCLRNCAGLLRFLKRHDEAEKLENLAHRVDVPVEVTREEDETLPGSNLYQKLEYPATIFH